MILGLDTDILVHFAMRGTRASERSTTPGGQSVRQLLAMGGGRNQHQSGLHLLESGHGIADGGQIPPVKAGIFIGPYLAGALVTGGDGRGLGPRAE